VQRVQREPIAGQSNHWLRPGLFSLLEKGVAMAFNLGTTLLLLRLLTPNDFAAWGLFVILGYFVEMGRSGLIQNAMIRHLALHRDNPETCAAISTAALTLHLCFSVFSNLLIWLGAGWMASYYQAPQLTHLLPVYFGINLVMAFYAHGYFVQQASSEFRGVFWGAVFLRGLPFGWVLCCWMTGMPVELPRLAVAMLAGSVVGGVAVWWYARPFLAFSRKPDPVWIGKLLDFGKYVLGTNLSTMFYKNIDKLTLGHLLGPAAFAVYDVAGKVTQLIEMPSFSVAAVVFPHGAGRMAREGAEGIKRLYERSVAAILAIILPFAVGVWCFAEEIMAVFAGPAYVAGADVLRLTAFFGLFLPFAVQFGTVLDSTGRPSLNFAFTCFTAMLNLGLSYGLVPVFGLFGAAYATLAGYALSFILMQVYLNRKFNINAMAAFQYIPEIYLILWRRLKPERWRAQV
jgi:O-antigen/teichoic acid export membrane protein